VQLELLLWSCGAGAVVVELWSCCCGVGAGARAPTRPTRPRSGKMLTFFFFVFVLFEKAGDTTTFGASPEPRSLLVTTQQAPELLPSSGSSGACLLQHSKLQKLQSLLELASPELACCCNNKQALELLRSFSGSGACLLLQRSELRSLSGASLTPELQS